MPDVRNSVGYFSLKVGPSAGFPQGVSAIEATGRFTHSNRRTSHQNLERTGL